MTRDRKAAGVQSRVPSEADILEFVQSRTERVGKREIARAFNIKGSDRIVLKRVLKDMTERGLLAKKQRRLHDPRMLPSVAVLEIVGTDADGETLAMPANWNAEEQGAAPTIIVDIRGGHRGADAISPAPGPGDQVLARLTATDEENGSAYVARVIRRLAGAPRRILGLFQRSRGGGMRIVPVDKKGASELEVMPGDDNGAESGELVAAEPARDRKLGLPRARVRERLGRVDDPRNISLVAIHQHRIPHRFREETIREAENLAQLDLSGRTDMRDIPLITIDPSDARDHDDAVWAGPDPDVDNEGGFIVIVAIADVAAYVRPGTALDREARDRGNSVYFPDRVVPMLPEALSTDLCSLKAGEDRPAIACIMTFDAAGTKRAHRFERVIIRSAAGLSYQQAQAAIDGHQDEDTSPFLEPVLQPLWTAHRALTEARSRRAPLELDIPERKLILDAHGLIERVVTPERLDAHKLIEEMMIQANVSAAETLEKARVPFLYRVHDAPAREKIEALAEFLQTIDISIAKGQTMAPQHFNRILERVRGSEHEHLVNVVVLRTQAQALYSAENAGHFGLNLRRYAHFTSPIRRYADLIVHRALISAHHFGNDGLSPVDIERLEETAELISQAERRAMAAERDTVDRLIASHLADRVGAEFAARIAGVTRAGLFVALDESGADGFVPAATLGDEYYAYDEATHALRGQETGNTYRLGDSVRVRLREVTPIAGGLRFEMLSTGRTEKVPSRRVRRSPRGAPRKGTKRTRGRRRS